MLDSKEQAACLPDTHLSRGSSTVGLEAGHAFHIGTQVHPAGLDAV
jgi:hypothetical protein